MGRHSNDRLRDWFASMLGMRALLATGPAPMFEAEPEDEDLSTRLERLDRSIDLDELSFAPDLRYDSAAEPLALRRLRQHEGVAPAAPAVLCPASADGLSRLIDIAGNCGLATASGRDPAPDDDRPVLPVSFHRMRRVDIVDPDLGLIRVERGTSWQDIIEADLYGDMAVPDGIDNLFATPVDAALACIFEARPLNPVNGDPTAFEMVLPPAGTRLLDGTWLFRDPRKAEAAFAEVCRRVPPFAARLYGESDLRIGEKIGLWSLPDRPWRTKGYTALRLVYLGNAMVTRAQRFASTFPVEGRGGVFWRNGAMMTRAERLSLILDNGLTEVTVPGLIDPATLATGRTGHAIQPIVTGRRLFAGGRLRRETSLILPRDFDDPLGQWRQLYRLALRATHPLASSASLASSAEADPLPIDRLDHREDTDPAEQAASPAPADDDVRTPTSESAEWRAIRAALMPAGEASPPPPDLGEKPLAPTRGAPSPRQSGDRQG